MTTRAASPPATASAKAAGYAKSADTRARILVAAMEEASERGIHETSLAAIAARAGVAIGSLNYHFGSREELLRELMVSLTAELMERLAAIDADAEVGFFERERRGLLVYLEHLRANPAYLRLAGEIELHEPKLYRRAVSDWLRRIATRIRDGIGRGDLRRMDEEEIAAQAYFMLGASQFLDHRARRGGEPFPDDRVMVEAYLKLLRGGLGAPARPRAQSVKPKPAARGAVAPRSQPVRRSE